MILRVDERFRREQERFHLRMHCEDCVLFDERLERCAHGFPTEPHRRPAHLEDGAPLLFCKDFEVV